MNSSYSVKAIQTDIFRPGQDLCEFVIRHLEGQNLAEGNIVVVTSKIVSLSENQRVPKSSVEKADLVKRESDVYLGEIGYGCHLTVKHGLLIPSAGIDESNSEGDYFVLFPKYPYESAKKLHQKLCEHFGIKNLGIIITDSHTTPLRRGVTGIALSYWGIRGVKNFIGHPDLFGRPLQMTYVNVVDALSSAAVFVMGEADEKKPLALIEGGNVEFTSEVKSDEIQIPPEVDLYAPILSKALTSNI